ncbi:MAG: 1-acyl-sn-glycerol-3-phosphate acyltransferase [Comamonadaceae bacterium CG_4_9_14_3_um_filter_60_33]|nr:MAG: 1-acyl-sn-glycerol-3-phosphate acyltransferase [Comamonadaceae bacterium CG_4_10_14_3_um_filter_60_42]PJB45529.1 MAG: 1-acyl-sn-glycerol-3-phosphate acyltransferase [Comamonadaceae bacterium CG_4_9_14_3_um_filter_60_33]
MKRSPWQLFGISLRLGHLTLHIACAFAVAGVYPKLGVLAQQRFMRWWSRSLLKLLKVKHHVSGEPHGAQVPACLMVANHVSWLDIFALNALTPARFVAKSEVSGWPVLGWLVQRAGTLFIRRAVRSDTVHVNARMAGLLQQGRAVGLFAQGTSSTPGQPVQFHAPLLQSAVAAGARVQPIAIFYHDQQGRWHAAAAFVDDITFVQSLWQIVCNPGIHVTVSYLPVIDACGLDRRALAVMTQCAVNAALDRHLQAG